MRGARRFRDFPVGRDRVPHESELTKLGPWSYSTAKIFFQSFFMLMMTQPFFFASS